LLLKYQYNFKEILDLKIFGKKKPAQKKEQALKLLIPIWNLFFGI